MSQYKYFMKAVIQPSILCGHINAPPSKSYTHRAIILAALADGKSQIKNALISDDTKATMRACKLLGAKISLKGRNIEIEGVNGRFPDKKSPILINCGLSGTTIRLMTAVAALSPVDIILTGEKRLKARPIGELVRVLKSLGVDIKASGNNQFPPVKIRGGGFPGGKITVSGEISSQFISALLIISPLAKKDTEITVLNLKSAPYVDITINLMKKFGVKVEKKPNSYKIMSGQKYKSRQYTVEGDYSSASYFFAAGAITHSKITVGNLNPDSVQGDKYFLAVLDKMEKNKLPEINLDLGNYPDIVPTVAVIAAAIPGTTTISDIGQLRMKETDRIAAITTELTKMKVNVKEKKDTLIISGGKLKGAEINTYNDHRMAMSFAIAGLAASGKTVIKNAEVVNKSYPDFWKDMRKLGAILTIIPDCQI